MLAAGLRVDFHWFALPRDDVADSFLDVLIFPKSAALASDDVMAAGDGVVEIGHATLSIEPQGQSPAQLEVKYVVYWRQENSRWKWHVDIWNMNA